MINQKIRRMVCFLIGMAAGSLFVLCILGMGGMTYRYYTHGEGLGELKGLGKKILMRMESDAQKRVQSSWQ